MSMVENIPCQDGIAYGKTFYCTKRISHEAKTFHFFKLYMETFREA